MPRHQSLIALLAGALLILSARAQAQGQTFTVTPSATANGTISPNAPQSVAVGQTVSFTLAPASGHILQSVTGSCGGSVIGLVFTTLPVVADCTVIATFATPILSLDKTSLNFGAVSNGTSFVSKTSPQTVRLVQTRPGTMTWTTASDTPWLKVSPPSGTGPGEISISVDHAINVPASGAAAGIVTVLFSSSPPVNLVVVLNVVPAAEASHPFGNVDSPVDNRTGVTGAVPFSGWVLDDVEVTRVMICRDAATVTEFAPVDPNCGGTQQIFLGFPVFIDGARPDVASFHSSHPLHTRAGWGFMVLTNNLPNQGNGTYRFTVWAEDREGNVKEIGRRTMTCENASATLPFGTIDTPIQGGVVSGTNFYNFGWALTPRPKTIPFDGSTINVLIDGASVGTVMYNNLRPDVAAVFPGLSNSNGAVGVRSIDTTLLTDGLHTISWTVVDDQGATEGIGSRYFTVANGSSPLTARVEVTAGSTGATQSARARVNVEELPRDVPWMVGRHGWDLASSYQIFSPSASGTFVVRGEEVGRVELHLASGLPYSWATTYDGYLRASGELTPLPVGSQLDKTTGQFTWAPGLGFVGSYDLVFVRSVGGRPVARRDVRVVLQPKGRGLVGLQVEIDAPKSQQLVEQPFVLGGWAADLSAPEGTGVTTLHAWAFPLAGGSPQFLGAATYGGSRPDVSAVHGNQFRESGYDFFVQGLAAGWYDLAVFAWSTERGGFVAPKMVRAAVR